MKQLKRWIAQTHAIVEHQNNCSLYDKQENCGILTDKILERENPMKGYTLVGVYYTQSEAQNKIKELRKKHGDANVRLVRYGDTWNIYVRKQVDEL